MDEKLPLCVVSPLWELKGIVRCSS